MHIMICKQMMHVAPRMQASPAHAEILAVGMHKVILHLKEDGSPEHPGLLRVPRDTEFVVRVAPNRTMYQVL